MYQATFTKLNFQLEFTSEGSLPKHKTAALRGGLGQMLLAQNCFGDSNDCENCSLVDSCLVQKIMYAKYIIRPDFVTKESMGFVLDCKDQHEYAQIGQGFSFSMTLFGNMVSYFFTILYALTSLGTVGIGKEQVSFVIKKITGRLGEVILEDGRIYLQNVKQETLQEYVEERFANGKNRKGIVRFLSPLSMKHRGEMLREFYPEAVLAGVARRIYMVNCFQGIAIEKPVISCDNIEVFEETSHLASVRRYSTTQGEGMTLRGIVGEIQMEGLTLEQQKMLLAGEVLHVGKNTKFGFGKYVFL